MTRQNLDYRALAKPESALATESFQRALRIGDLVIISLVIVFSHLVRFGAGDAAIATIRHGSPTASYVLLGVAIILTWWLLLAALKSYREHLLGYGSDEYHRVFQATITEFGGLALLSYLAGVELSRGYFLVALPTGLMSLQLWRWLARRRLVKARKSGAFTHPTFIVGSSESVPAVIAEIGRRPELGLAVVGVFLSDADAVGPETGLSSLLIGDTACLPRRVSGAEGITLIIARESGLNPSRIRRISWMLGPTSRLVMVPSMLDVAGPRLHLRPVDGISLIEIQVPRLDGIGLLAKRLFDILVSTTLIAALAPLWIVIPALIRVGDHGPALFRQTRVGLRGREFRIWKFRTMRVNADAELTALLARQGTADRPLFKIDNDPRITRIGRFLRRASLDELPQLFNVLQGTMSLVGPRPQVPAEVELYDDVASRRLLTKPGITGLWQVNGRSSLPWEEALRFDLFYVENWSLSMDIRILFKTLRVVITQDGSA